MTYGDEFPGSCSHCARRATMRWIADQGEHIARLARLPWSGDDANVENIRAELQRTLDALPDEREARLARIEAVYPAAAAEARQAGRR